MNDRKYTVKELIEKLQQIDGSYIVYHEGCDCNGLRDGNIEIYTDIGEIIINRY